MAERHDTDAKDDSDLELIPRSVRDKLDRIGIKLHLRDWQLLDLAARRLLCGQPCNSVAEVAAYRSTVERLVLDATGQAPERLRR